MVGELELDFIKIPSSFIKVVTPMNLDDAFTVRESEEALPKVVFPFTVKSSSIAKLPDGVIVPSIFA